MLLALNCEWSKIELSLLNLRKNDHFLEQSKSVSNHMNSPRGIQLNKMATIETKSEMTKAWHWHSAKFPKTIDLADFGSSKVFIFAAVDSLDARVISKLPFNPKSGGTSIKSSWMSSKTAQCWTLSNRSPAKKSCIKSRNERIKRSPT